MATDPKLAFVSKQVATSYEFRGEAFGWAICTVNDATGELSIQSDWGNWSHRWSPDPKNLGAPTLTAFIGGRGDVDYIARKLQNEGRNGRRWSAAGTVAELRHRLCQRRIYDGRAQIDGRLDPDDMPGGVALPHLSDRYDESGLPIFSHRMPAEYRGPWKLNGDPYDPIPFLTRESARRLWVKIGSIADSCSPNQDSFYKRVQKIDGFSDYVTEHPWEYHITEQTPEDKALRDLVLPALISKLREGM